MTAEATAEVRAWFTGRLPQEWTVDGAAEVVVDREEITVVVPLEGPTLGDDATDAERAQALAGRVQGWREQTREQRMGVAREAEHRFDRKVAWAVRTGEELHRFTHLAVPVMTRLRQPERQVLDTLVEAGVARSRAHALAWCVRLVGENADDWLGELRDAMEQVREVRRRGPVGGAA
ncbi:MAG: hypothetical protein ACTHN8_06310 [Angustibacter sp.]